MPKKHVFSVCILKNFLTWEGNPSHTHSSSSVASLPHKYDYSRTVFHILPVGLHLFEILTTISNNLYKTFKI